MKKILVPTDFSKCAEYAAQVAIAVASKSKASIHFLHIMPNPNVDFHVPHVPGVPVRSSQKTQAHNNLDRLVSNATHAGLQASQLLVFDKGNEKIEHYVKPLGIDFIVMGSHGATGIRELVIGSNTKRVVRHAHVPVLVVKSTAPGSFDIKNIVYASPFQEDDNGALDVVTDLARLWKASLNILFINLGEKKISEANQDKIINQLKTKIPDVSITGNSIQTNDEEWGIHQFARLIDADIITLTTQDKEGIIFQRKVAEELVNHEELPVLVIN